MEKDIHVYLADIVESVEHIEEYITNLKTFQEFQKDIKSQDAIIRRFMIIGEAVKHLPDALRHRHSDIPWKKIAGIRDIFVHEYSGIDLIQIWNIIGQDLPMLKRKVREMLRNGES